MQLGFFLEGGGGFPSISWALTAATGTVKSHKKMCFPNFGKWSLEKVVCTPGKLKLEEKARILAWKEEGISSAKIAKQLGWHRASIDCLLAKTKGSS